MADEQLDPTQTAPQAAQDAPAAEPAPRAAAVADSDTPPQVTADPTSGPSPSTSPDATAAAPGSPVAQPVVVNNYTVRSDDDALLGSWVDVIGGPNQGRFGSYVDTVHHDPETGYPSVILIRSRDARNELLEVAYSDVRPSERTGGR